MTLVDDALCDLSVFVTTVQEDHAGEVFQDIVARCQFDDHDSSPAKTWQIDQGR
jgi:hypothetical protein